MTRKKNAAGNAAPGVPFRKGVDPRRFKGGPGIGGRRRDEVRAACLLAFDQRVPRLEQLADADDAGVALKALDMLARYGGLVYTEAESRVDVTAPAAEVRLYRLPSNGRESAEYPPPEPVSNWRGPERRSEPR